MSEEAQLTKAQRTRARILEAALTSFTEKGYAATTMRDIAARADCALGLLYRYFPRRESFVLALYDRITADFVSDVQALPAGTMANRFASAMHSKMNRLEPHRAAFVGLVGAALDRQSGASVLGAESDEIRKRVEQAFEQLVVGSNDAPQGDRAAALSRLLFVVQLLIVLVWTQDQSEGAALSHRFVDLATSGLRAVNPMLPMLDPAIRSLADLVSEFLEPAAAAELTGV